MAPQNDQRQPMRSPREVEIGGYRYTLGTLTPRRSLMLGNRLVRAAGPAIMTLLSAPGDLLEQDVTVLGTAIAAIFERLKPEEQDSIMQEVLQPVMVAGPKGMVSVWTLFDAHFQGRLPAALELTWEALKENFQDFGPALAGLVGKAGATTSASTSPTTS